MSQPDYLVVVWEPGLCDVKTYANDPSGNATYTYGDKTGPASEQNAPDTLFIEKRADGWAMGYVEGD